MHDLLNIHIYSQFNLHFCVDHAPFQKPPDNLFQILNNHMDNLQLLLLYKSQSTHLLYFGPMREDNMSLTPARQDNIEDLIGNIKVNKGLFPNSIPTKTLID